MDWDVRYRAESAPRRTTGCGHILYAFFSRRHKTVSKLVCAALLPMGWFWMGWLFWGLILLWLGRRHPFICDDSDLGAGRRKLGWIALAIFLLCFAYAPVAQDGLRDLLKAASL